MGRRDPDRLSRESRREYQRCLPGGSVSVHCVEGWWRPWSELCRYQSDIVGVGHRGPNQIASHPGSLIWIVVGGVGNSQYVGSPRYDCQYAGEGGACAAVQVYVWSICGGERVLLVSLVGYWVWLIVCHLPGAFPRGAPVGSSVPPEVHRAVCGVGDTHSLRHRREWSDRLYRVCDSALSSSYGCTAASSALLSPRFELPAHP